MTHPHCQHPNENGNLTEIKHDEYYVKAIKEFDVNSSSVATETGESELQDTLKEKQLA